MGAEHVVALSAQASVYSWGMNNEGQLGVGHTSPVPGVLHVSTLDGTAIRQVDYVIYYMFGTDPKSRRQFPKKISKKIECNKLIVL